MPAARRAHRSWAEYVWWRAGLVEGFRPNIRTLDIDFLVRNMRRPIPEAHLTAVAREHGYLVESDRLTGVTKIYSLGGLEVEFLIGKVGAGREDSLKMNLGVVAQSLRHLDVLARFTAEAELEGLRVRVLTLEAYAIHKMAVNHERGRKQQKDAEAIKRIWPHLDRTLLELVLESCTKRERSRSTRSWRNTGWDDRRRRFTSEYIVRSGTLFAASGLQTCYAVADANHCGLGDNKER